MKQIKQDTQKGFYYYEYLVPTLNYKVVLFRSKDICNILGISETDTALEKHYINLMDAAILAVKYGKTDFADYLETTFIGDHVHRETPGAPLLPVLPEELENTDRDWSNLI